MIASFSLPAQLRFGEGALTVLPQELAVRGVTNPLLVTDRGLFRGAVFQRLHRLIPEAELFDEIDLDASEQGVLDAAELFVTSNCNGIVALGGGTVIDASKAIRLKIHHPFPLEEYSSGKGRVTQELPVLVAIPTTAGTGSEVSPFAAIRIGGRKRYMGSEHLTPTLAILDPELTLPLPPTVTGGSGLTAFAHCLEAFLSGSYHPLRDATALEGARLAITALPRLARNPNDLEARRDMILAAAAGTIALQQTRSMCDALAVPLSTAAGIAHGTAVASLLPAVCAMLMAKQPLRAAEFAARTGCPDPGAWLRETPSGFGLRPHALSAEQSEECAEEASADLARFGIALTQTAAVAVYRQAW